MCYVLKKKKQKKAKTIIKENCIFINISQTHKSNRAAMSPYLFTTFLNGCML